MEDKKHVSVRCDVFLRLVEGLDKSEELAALLGEPVTEALVVVAENDDLRIENGGSVHFSAEEKKRFLLELNRLTYSGETVASELKEGKKLAPEERVRTRCDVLASIIKALGSAKELREIYGGSVLKNLVIIAEGGDLRIENSGATKLTDGQSSIFLGILNQVIEDQTS
jgi:hypothetical protein